jgi:Ca-activated chloride channel family protein
MRSRAIRQIIVVTDGHANLGHSPVDAARVAFTEGVTVSAIGILDGGHLGDRGRREVEKVADAGGGVADCVISPDLSKTLHTVTWQATQCTLNMIISQELKRITGLPWKELPPDKRAGIIDLMAGLADGLDLQIALLLDTSASMTGKMPAVLRSVQDLILSLQERKGETNIFVARYPGRERVIEAIAGCAGLCWDDLRPAGRTPTGPAILEILAMMIEKQVRLKGNLRPVLDVVL